MMAEKYKRKNQKRWKNKTLKGNLQINTSKRKLKALKKIPKYTKLLFYG
jgi:hypothetical protein